MREISLHLLDIAENSVAAESDCINISVCEDLQNDRLCAIVEDNGKGMDAETIERVVDPFVTSRTTRNVGLGIPLLKEATEQCNGTFKIQSDLGRGTVIKMTFQHSHIDRMPLGDLAGTYLSLLVAHPEITWMFGYCYISANGEILNEFCFDGQEVKETLDGIPLTDPVVLAYLREIFQSGIEVVH